MDEISSEIELHEFLEQVNYVLSTQFKDKWRHKYSPNFIEIFQTRLLKALKDKRPVKKSSLTSLFINKHKYNLSEVEDFYESIDIFLYHPLVYNT